MNARKPSPRTNIRENQIKRIQTRRITHWEKSLKLKLMTETNNMYYILNPLLTQFVDEKMQKKHQQVMNSVKNLNDYDWTNINSVANSQYPGKHKKFKCIYSECNDANSLSISH
jgi:hypothetical protein